MWTSALRVTALAVALPVSRAALFFSAQAEGSSYNKYLEVFNPSCQAVQLDTYLIRSITNGGDDFEHDHTFDAGATIPAGGTWVICDPRANAQVLANCDQQNNYLSNGDDTFGLVGPDGVVLDQIGDLGEDPGAGWDVAGLPAATKDHTIVRKQHVMAGNAGAWAASAGTNDADGEWTVLDRDAWWPVVERACERGCILGDCVGAPSPTPPPPPPPTHPPPPPSPPQASDPVAVPRPAALRAPNSLFFSALAEGNSYNKYLELFNPTCADASTRPQSSPQLSMISRDASDRLLAMTGIVSRLLLPDDLQRRGWCDSTHFRSLSLTSLAAWSPLAQPDPPFPCTLGLTFGTQNAEQWQNRQRSCGITRTLSFLARLYLLVERS